MFVLFFFSVYSPLCLSLARSQSSSSLSTLALTSFPLLLFLLLDVVGFCLVHSCSFCCCILFPLPFCKCCFLLYFCCFFNCCLFLYDYMFLILIYRRLSTLKFLTCFFCSLLIDFACFFSLLSL